MEQMICGSGLILLVDEQSRSSSEAPAQISQLVIGDAGAKLPVQRIRGGLAQRKAIEVFEGGQVAGCRTACLGRGGVRFNRS